MPADGRPHLLGGVDGCREAVLLRPQSIRSRSRSRAGAGQWIPEGRLYATSSGRRRSTSRSSSPVNRDSRASTGTPRFVYDPIIPVAAMFPGLNKAQPVPPMLASSASSAKGLSFEITCRSFSQSQSLVEVGVVIGAALEAQPVHFVRHQVAAALGAALQSKPPRVFNPSHCLSHPGKSYREAVCPLEVA